MIVSRLSRLMGDRRLTIQSVAQATGLAFGTVAGLYHDRAERFDRHTLDALCAHLDVPLCELLERVPPQDAAAAARVGQPRGERPQPSPSSA